MTMSKILMEFRNAKPAIKDGDNGRITQHIKIHDSNAKIKVTTVKPKKYTSELLDRYSLAKYDLCPNFTFPDELSGLVPKNTPVFVDGGDHYLQRLMRSLLIFKQCALIGASGTGKTHSAYLVAEMAGLPLWEINCRVQTSVYDLFGRYIGLGKENWVDGQIVSWAKHGGLLCLDEANMMKPDIATRLNSLLDPRGHLVLTEKDNEVIQRHQHAYVIMSMNPFSSEFVGVKQLNISLRRRMNVWINFDYLSVGETINSEEVLLVQESTGVNEDTAKRIVKVGAELRNRYKAGDLSYAPSVGDLINWGKIICYGDSPQSAAEDTIIAVTSDRSEVQDIVRQVVGMFFDNELLRP
jgi:MoxR-like ATPase